MGLALGLAIAGCGAGSGTGASARSGSGSGARGAGGARGGFAVRVVTASFPQVQRLAERSVLVIAVRNTGSHTIPDVAVTLRNPASGAGAGALSLLIAPAGQGQPPIANRSRPIWVIDRAPGPCGFSCRQGGAGAAATSTPNTWALGRLRPGATARFEWHVTAVRAGHYTIDYTIAAGLSGPRTRAAAAGGRAPTGSFHVAVSAAIPHPRVTSSGRVVSSD